MSPVPPKVGMISFGQGESPGDIPTSDGVGGYSWSSKPSMALDITSKPYNGRGDGGIASDGAMTSGDATNTLTTSAAALMTVGMKVYVRGASGGTMLNTTVSSLVDATHVRLALGATTTVSGAVVVYGTDNLAAVNAAEATGHTIWWPNPTNQFYLVDIGVTGTGTIRPGGGFLKWKGESRDQCVIKLGPEGATSQDHVLIGSGSGDQVVMQDLTLEGQEFLGNGGPPADPGIPAGATRNYGISHGGATGEIRLMNVRIRKFVSCAGVNATNSVAGIQADFCHFQGYGSTYRSIPLGAVEGSSSAWVSTKRIRCHGCRFSDFGDPTGGNLYHAVYVSTGWALDLEQCYFHTASPTSTGAVIQHYDGYVTLATAAPISRFTNCDLGPDLAGMSGIISSYNTQTEVVGCKFDLLVGTSVLAAGPVVIDDCEFVANATLGNALIQTVVPGQATGLTWGAQITNCRFRGSASTNGPNAIKISNSSATSDFTVRGSQFTGFTSAGAGYILIFGATGVVGGNLDVVDCRFSDNPGYNIQAANSSTGMRVSVRGTRFYTGNGTTCIKTAATAPALLAVKSCEFSQATATDAFNLAVAPTVSEITDNYGTAGYKTANGGSSTSTPGAVTTVNIPHLLGNAGRAITPTKVSVQAGDANARGAPTFHVTMGATNITLNFSAALTAATAYTWLWKAEA